jgi:hypothetical protein
MKLEPLYCSWTEILPPSHPGHSVPSARAMPVRQFDQFRRASVGPSSRFLPRNRVNVIGFSERAFGIAQCEVYAVSFVDQFIEILGFAGEGLLQEPEEVFARRALVVVSELHMVASSGGCVFYYQAEIAVLKPVFVHYLAGDILIPKYVQN